MLEQRKTPFLCLSLCLSLFLSPLSPPSLSLALSSSPSLPPLSFSAFITLYKGTHEWSHMQWSSLHHCVLVQSSNNTITYCVYSTGLLCIWCGGIYASTWTHPYSACLCPGVPSLSRQTNLSLQPVNFSFFYQTLAVSSLLLLCSGRGGEQCLL